ncbi:MAG: hypothetical protein HOD92_11430 [Deltaproteobacteria bacterium]|jgi:hypothetical protein|nr:hypothetical protein [Deltaproteobacteria bacterium]MBT4525972.1 hypothetical protein [Deltaproteobacteria bacterium]
MLFRYINHLKVVSTILVFISLDIIFCDQVDAQEAERFPLAGHPVSITAIHPDDKYASFLNELSAFSLILMEPGIQLNQEYSRVNNEKWYQAKIFLLKGKSKKFSRRQIIHIKMGRFE